MNEKVIALYKETKRLVNERRDYAREHGEKSAALKYADTLANRVFRMDAVRVLTETTELDVKELDILSDMILEEELSSTLKTKMQALEYSFMSDRMEQTRKGGEASFKLSEEQGVDGRNYKKPYRRELARHEAIFVDKKAKSRNDGRKKQYNEFTKVQPVHTFHISELDA